MPMNALLMAAIIAVATDDFGERIVLTDDWTNACAPTEYVAYAVERGGRTTWGCWVAEDDFLHITWQFVGGRTSHHVFSLDQFERRRPLPAPRIIPGRS
jgi:hypothetical protein